MSKSAAPIRLELAIRLAILAMKRAYCPYSKYHVGALVVGESGSTYSGCNIENASYGLTMCAERTAIFNAVSKGEKRIKAIYVATRDGGAPCGACRQVMTEFADNSMPVYLINSVTGRSVKLSLGELMPRAFRVF